MRRLRMIDWRMRKYMIDNYKFKMVLRGSDSRNKFFERATKLKPEELTEELLQRICQNEIDCDKERTSYWDEVRKNNELKEKIDELKEELDKTKMLLKYKGIQPKEIFIRYEADDGDYDEEGFYCQDYNEHQETIQVYNFKVTHEDTIELIDLDGDEYEIDGIIEAKLLSPTQKDLIKESEKD